MIQDPILGTIILWQIVYHERQYFIIILLCAIVIVNHISDVADNKLAESSAVLMFKKKKYGNLTKT